MVRAELARQVALLRAPAIHSAVGCAVTPSHKIWRRPAPLYQAISTLILEQFQRRCDARRRNRQNQGAVRASIAKFSAGGFRAADCGGMFRYGRLCERLWAASRCVVARERPTLAYKC
jgi:hypothetical protein